MNVAAIIPAHNEAERVGRVLEAVLATPIVSRVILVDDGSTDGTAQIGARYEGVRVERFERNRGKGGAMLWGATVASDADVLLFLDADLIGLTPEHVAQLLEPVVSGKTDMALGQFTAGRGATDLAQLIVPFITGQRAILRPLFESIPDLDRVGFGIEMAITLHVKAAQRPVSTVLLRGVTHPMKEEKLGFWRGAWARMKMYREMLAYVVTYKLSGRAKNARRLSDDYAARAERDENRGMDSESAVDLMSEAAPAQQRP
ncbi:MAG: glycosyltransferase family 2 protein [Capsulimonadaceae bacterium]|nr:glycosyltransferase family 2 protein [Capsulimonadaceae bacterium]